MTAAADEQMHLVTMLEAKQRNEQDLDQNYCGRFITATFLIGPDKVRFRCLWSNKNYEGMEYCVCDIPGVKKIKYRKWSDNMPYEYGAGEFLGGTEPKAKDFPNQRIKNFLEETGLLGRLPEEGYCWGDRLSREEMEALSEEEKMRWVYGDIIRRVMELVMEKVGHGEDSFGVGWPMGEECAYTWMGLEW